MKNIALAFTALTAVAVALAVPTAQEELLIEKIITCSPMTILHTITQTRAAPPAPTATLPPGHRDPSQQSHPPVVISDSPLNPDTYVSTKSAPKIINPLTYKPTATQSTKILPQPPIAHTPVPNAPSLTASKKSTFTSDPYASAVPL